MGLAVVDSVVAGSEAGAAAGWVAAVKGSAAGWGAEAMDWVAVGWEVGWAVADWAVADLEAADWVAADLAAVDLGVAGWAADWVAGLEAAG